MSDATTEFDATVSPRDRARAEDRLALVVTFSRDEPERVGEVFFLPSENSPSILLGRGGGRPDDAPHVRGGFVRQRPGLNETTAPLQAQKISRRQLLFSHRGGRVEVENVGRAPLATDGARVDRALVRPGHSLHLEGLLSLYCTPRPVGLPALRSWPKSASPDRFGGPDRFGLVGETPWVWDLRDRLAFAAARDLHVLIGGPTGTGKELGARAIHGLSSRSSKTLVSRNASTLPSGLIDAELFGNVRDYPNPGMKARDGLVGSAHGGTLFLDEIGELPEALQAHLLRVLDSGGEYQTLGDGRVRRSDFRLVAATNRDPAALKHDLLARLTLRISLAPLDERRADIPLLVAALARGAVQSDPALAEQFLPEPGAPPRLAQDLVDHCLHREYEHNVRELMTVLWRSIAESRGHKIELDPALATRAVPQRLEQAPEDIGADEVRAALARHDGVLERVWRDLGLRNRHVLRRLLKKHGLDPKG